jgi:predicted nucleic acid-binding protein
MSRVILDASFAASWILPDEASRESQALLRAVLEKSAALQVPALWMYEMLNLFRISEKRGRLTQVQVGKALQLLNALPLDRHPPPTGNEQLRVLELGRQFDLTAYDASYLALGERLQAPLASKDLDLQRAAREINLPVLPAF